MPLQNRVLPTGEIVADPARGLFIGNRGILHDDQQRLGRARWKGKAWIICELSYKGWRRQVMTPHRWTELFFLDEAVALAAGHRPCALCRREAYLAYRAAWGGGLKAVEMDRVLHEARVSTCGQRHFFRDINDLPEGVFILHQGRPCLIHEGHVHPYCPSGYSAPIAMPQGVVEVMTPAPSVSVLAAGYQPVLHPTVATPLPDAVL